MAAEAQPRDCFQQATEEAGVEACSATTGRFHQAVRKTYGATRRPISAHGTDANGKQRRGGLKHVRAVAHHFAQGALAVESATSGAELIITITTLGVGGSPEYPRQLGGLRHGPTFL